MSVHAKLPDSFLRYGAWVGVILAAMLALVSTRLTAQETDAVAILKAMSDYVSSQQTIELSFDSAIEVITPQLEKIQFTNSGEALLSRPDKLRAHRVSGHADVALYFDGKQVTIYGKSINGYTQFEAPSTVDQLIHALRTGHGVALPGAGAGQAGVGYSGGVGVNLGGPVNRVGVR
jgi:hypothetical protein